MNLKGKSSTDIQGVSVNQRMKKIEHEKPRFMKKFVHKSIWAYHYATDATNDGQQA